MGEWEGWMGYHGILIVRSVLRVGILIALRTFDFLHLPPDGDVDQYYFLQGMENLNFFRENLKIPTPMTNPLPSHTLTVNINRCIMV